MTTDPESRNLAAAIEAARTQPTKDEPVIRTVEVKEGDETSEISYPEQPLETTDQPPKTQPVEEVPPTGETDAAAASLTPAAGPSVVQVSAPPSGPAQPGGQVPAAPEPPSPPAEVPPVVVPPEPEEVPPSLRHPPSPEPPPVPVSIIEPVVGAGRPAEPGPVKPAQPAPTAAGIRDPRDRPEFLESVGEGLKREFIEKPIAETLMAYQGWQIINAQSRDWDIIPGGGEFKPIGWVADKGAAAVQRIRGASASLPEQSIVVTEGGALLVSSPRYETQAYAEAVDLLRPRGAVDIAFWVILPAGDRAAVFVDDAGRYIVKAGARTAAEAERIAAAAAKVVAESGKQALAAPALGLVGTETRIPTITRPFIPPPGPFIPPPAPPPGVLAVRGPVALATRVTQQVRASTPRHIYNQVTYWRGTQTAPSARGFRPFSATDIRAPLPSFFNDVVPLPGTVLDTPEAQARAILRHVIGEQSGTLKSSRYLDSFVTPQDYIAANEVARALVTDNPQLVGSILRNSNVARSLVGDPTVYGAFLDARAAVLSSFGPVLVSDFAPEAGHPTEIERRQEGAGGPQEIPTPAVIAIGKPIPSEEPFQPEFGTPTGTPTVSPAETFVPTGIPTPTEEPRPERFTPQRPAEQPTPITPPEPTKEPIVEIPPIRETTRVEPIELPSTKPLIEQVVQVLDLPTTGAEEQVVQVQEEEQIQEPEQEPLPETLVETEPVTETTVVTEERVRDEPERVPQRSVEFPTRAREVSRQVGTTPRPRVDLGKPQASQLQESQKRRNLISWRQGEVWITVWEPYTEEDVSYTLKKPANAVEVRGPREAWKRIKDTGWQPHEDSYDDWAEWFQSEDVITEHRIITHEEPFTLAGNTRVFWEGFG